VLSLDDERGFGRSVGALDVDITTDGSTVENNSSLTGNPAVTISGDDVTFVNKAGGTVAGHPAIMILGSGATIVNEAGAEIRGEGAVTYWWEKAQAIRGSQFADIVVNYGRLQGQIALGGGNDRFEYHVSSANRDAAGASIDLEAGDDEAVFHTAGIDSLYRIFLTGGEGYDTVRFDGIGNLSFPNSWFSFERAVFTGTGEGSQVFVDDFDGFQEFVGSPGLTLNLVRSNSPKALVRVEGGHLSLDAVSDVGTISGTAAAEKAVIRGDVFGNVDMGGGNDIVELEGMISGAVTLGAGDDLFDVSGSNSGPGNRYVPGGHVTGTVDGGPGTDRLILFDSTGRTFDLRNFTSFEQFEVDGDSEGDVRLTHLDSIQSLTVRVYRRAEITIGETLAPSLQLLFSPYSYGADIVIESTATLGSIDRHDGPSGPGRDWDPSQNVNLRIDGTIAGDVGLWNGNDHIDARLGSVAGTVFGRDGNDSILMGSGADRVDGGFGDDLVDGGAGDDSLVGSRGRDELRGGAGRDTLGGGFDDDRLYGGDGDDMLRETEGLGDWLIGGAGNDVIELERVAYSSDPVGSFVVDGGSGDDRILIDTGYSNESNVYLDAGEGDDHITLGYLAGWVNIRLGGGADTIVMDKFLEGRRRTVTLLDFAAGEGGDTIDLGDLDAGELQLIQRGTDTWLVLSRYGGVLIFTDTNAASFTAANFSGHDPVVLNPPVTVHEGTSGPDSFTATGDDLYFLNHAGDSVWEPDYSSYDEVRSALAQLVLPESIERLVLTGWGQQVTGNWSDSVVTATDGDDVLLFGQGGQDRIAARGGDDLVYFGAYFTSADIVDGGPGRDQLILRGSYPAETMLMLSEVRAIEALVLLSAADTRFGPAGGTPFSYAITATDAMVPANGVLDVDATSLRDGESLVFDGSGEKDGRFDLMGGAGADSLVGGAGNDLIDGGAGADAIRAGHGDDSLSGGDGDDAMEGGDGIDILLGDSGNDSIDAGTGNDVVHGGAGNDSIAGGAGDDFLHSDNGNDILSGGDGDDRLYFGAYFTSADRADGGAGLDQLILRGHYPAEAALVLGFGPAFEKLVLLSSADTQFGPAEGGSFSYVIATTASPYPYTGLLEVDATSLRPGESLIFDGWREPGGRFHLRGGAGADRLIGGNGHDLIDGGMGADVMRGWYGNDVYIVDSASDVVEERGGEGTDEVRTALAVYSLVAFPNVENLTAIYGVAHDLRGNGSNNVVTGLGGSDVIRLQDGGDDSAVGGGGDDQIFYGAAFNYADRNDGGAGTDVVVLQGDYVVTLGAGTLTNVEYLSLQSGSSTRYEKNLPLASHDYSIGLFDDAVAAGQRLIVNASQLLAGEDFTFDGTRESDGSFLIYGGFGADLLVGGSGHDVFHFEGSRWGAGDSVDGGAGADSVVIRAGSGTHRIQFSETQLIGVESLSVSDRFGLGQASLPSYEMVLANGNVAAGGTLIVNGSTLLDPGQKIDVDGSAVRDGHLKLYGGAGGDTLIGGAGDDLIFAGGGADRMTGGAGRDVFQLRSLSDSPLSGPDLILDFVSGTDKIDLGFIDADSIAAGNQAFTFVGSQAFSSQAGQLRAVETSPGSNVWIVSGDVDGDSNADFQISVTVAGGNALSGSDFLP
jgi:Ca2+-binding RTX toxin-like protein